MTPSDAGLLVGLVLRTIVLFWVVQYSWGTHFVIGMLLFDTAELRWKTRSRK